jgi:hypothetical protein
VLFLDIDAAHGAAGLESAAAVHRALIEAVPALAAAGALVQPSSSAGIVNSDTGEVLKPAGSWHVYILVADASDIERCGRAIYERTWLAGHGRYAVSRAGRLLDRSLVDQSVWQPERLDFAGSVRMAPPLVRRAPAGAAFNSAAGFFDSRRVLDLNSDERTRFEQLKADAKAPMEGEAAQRREQWALEHAKARVQSENWDGDERDERERQYFRDYLAAAEYGRLPVSLLLYPEDGEPVTVGDVLREADKWNDQRFADPLDPDYRDDPRVAVFFRNSGTRPQIYSHAHGGCTYSLGADRVPLRVVAGDSPILADNALEVLRERSELYDFGDRALVRVVGGRMVEVTETWLSDYLAREIRFFRFDKRGKEWHPCNPPPVLAQTILARSGARGLKSLTAIINAPTMRADGSLLDSPGHDPDTGLLYVLSDGNVPPRIPLHPTADDARRAVATLWRPFRDFPLDGPVSRSVVLAALLTAAVRPALPTAPAFAFDAPAAGSGKSLLASCLAELRGERAAVTAPPRDDAEMGKFLVASLLAGAPVIVLDNWVSSIDGNAFPSLCAAITGAEVYGRILGRSETVRLPNRALVALTGNNLTIAADMVRRVLVARLDAGVDRPELRRFDLDPAAYIRAHRGQMVSAALTVLRAYQVIRATDNYVFGPPAEAAFGSFETWDELVRQAVVWIGQPEREGGLALPPGFADPAMSAATSAVADPTRNALAAMLGACRAKFGSGPFTAADLLRPDFDNEALEDARALVFDGRPMSGAAIGRWLSRNRGAVADGMRFDSELDSHTKMQRWRVVVRERELFAGDAGASGGCSNPSRGKCH